MPSKMARAIFQKREVWTKLHYGSLDFIRTKIQTQWIFKTLLLDKEMKRKFCCKCCKKEQAVKEEFSLLALGLGGAGKSTLLSTVCGEVEEEIVPTKGFSIKDISLARAKLHVKEVGGSESIRRYWHHYFSGVEGLIFVVDGSTNDDEVTLARSELAKVLSHRDMTDVPLLVLVNKIDSSDSSSLQKFSEQLDVPKLCASRSFLIDAYSLKDVSHLKMLLEKFVDVIKRPGNYAEDNEEIDQEITGRI